MPLSPKAKTEIREYLYKQVHRFVQESLKAPGYKPFHVRLMPILGESQFSERSFSTRSGSWFQRIALQVARDFHRRAESNFAVKGKLSPAAEAHINEILEDMDHGKPKRKPNRKKELEEVMTVQGKGGADREVVSDLFVETKLGRELYFELKTPGPNKGQCKVMKRNILLISALRKNADAEAFASAAYNPYGEGSPYIYGYAKQFLEIDKDFLVGKPFWTMIGDKSTYDELLEISESVGRQIQPLVASKSKK